MTDVKKDAVDFVKMSKSQPAQYNSLVQLSWDPTGMNTYTFTSANSLYNQASA